MRRARTARSPGCLARWLGYFCLALLCAKSLAQDTGQICLQAFADQDGDGQRAATEAPIVRGVAASLVNDRGITVSSQLLEDSPYADDGLLCFDQLRAGDYRLIISSSEYIATTATVADAAVQPGSAPARIDFGAKSLAVVAAPGIVSGLEALDADAVWTLLVAAGSAIVAIVVMSLLGCLMVALILRRRNRARSLQPQSGVISGASPARSTEDASSSPRMMKDPNEGSPPLFTDEDQEW